MPSFKKIFSILLINFLTIVSNAQIVWSESFAIPGLGFWGDADGKTVHSAPEPAQKWALDCTRCTFEDASDYLKTVTTSGGRLEAVDIGGEAVWTSAWISIRNLSGVSVSLLAKETGSGKDGLKKYLKAFVEIDDREARLFDEHASNEGDWGEATATCSGISGDSFRIVVRIMDQYASDKVILDEVAVLAEAGFPVSGAKLILPGTLLINEVLFNPYPNEVDFVEFYNASEDTVNLKNLWLANRNDTLGIRQKYRITTEDRWLLPGCYVACSTSPEVVLSRYPTNDPGAFCAMKSMPSYNDDEGHVVLLNDSLQVVDEFHYSEKMHHALLADPEGVSLERISADRPTNEWTNWTSAAHSVGFATPGLPNSQTRQPVSVSGEITLESDVISPNGDGFNDQARIAYQFETPGFVANVRVFDVAGRLINNLARNELLAQSGTWVWDGQTASGDRVGLGVYVILIDLLDPDGRRSVYKKVCSVTDRIK